MTTLPSAALPKKTKVLCPNPDCVGGRDVERGDTCRTCDGDEFVKPERLVGLSEERLRGMR
jgi:hypothetical protein